MRWITCVVYHQRIDRSVMLFLHRLAPFPLYRSAPPGSRSEHNSNSLHTRMWCRPVPGYCHAAVECPAYECSVYHVFLRSPSMQMHIFLLVLFSNNVSCMVTTITHIECFPSNGLRRFAFECEWCGWQNCHISCIRGNMWRLWTLESCKNKSKTN